MTRRRGGNQSDANSSAGEREDDLRLKDLLNEFDGVDQTERKSFFSTLTNNHDLQAAIFRYFARDRDHLSKKSPGIDSAVDADRDTLVRLCNMMLLFYRSVAGFNTSKNNFMLASTANDIARSRVVVLQFVPHIVAFHMTSRRWPDKKSYRFVDTFLLAVYNSEVTELQQLAAMSNAINASATSISSSVPANPLQQSFPNSLKVPGLSTSSLFHDSSKLDTESVDKLEGRAGSCGFFLSTTVFQPVEVLNATTRPQVLQLLMQSFNRYIVDVPKFGLDHFTRVTLRMLERGYGGQPKPNKESPGPVRIVLPPQVLIEMLYSAYVCMYNGFQVVGNQIVDLIQMRATANGWPSVLLVCDSIKNLSVTSSPSQVAFAHVSTPGQLAKNMITNASFRAKKMHQDIPKVQVEGAEGEAAAHAGQGQRVHNNCTNMTSITEEEEDKAPSKGDSTNKVSNKEKLMAKLPNLSNVGIRKKDKDKDKGDDSKEANAASDAIPLRSKASFERKERKESAQGKADKKKDKKMLVLADSSASMKSYEDKVHNGEPSSTSSSSATAAAAAAAAANANATATNAAVPPGAGNSKDVDTMEQVEELIQMKKLPPETIIIHSPESGTTIF